MGLLSANHVKPVKNGGQVLTGLALKAAILIRVYVDTGVNCTVDFCFQLTQTFETR